MRTRAQISLYVVPKPFVHAFMRLRSGGYRNDANCCAFLAVIVRGLERQEEQMRAFRQLQAARPTALCHVRSLYSLVNVPVRSNLWPKRLHILYDQELSVPLSDELWVRPAGLRHCSQRVVTPEAWSRFISSFT